MPSSVWAKRAGATRRREKRTSAMTVFRMVFIHFPFYDDSEARAFSWAAMILSQRSLKA